MNLSIHDYPFQALESATDAKAHTVIVIVLLSSKRAFEVFQFQFTVDMISCAGLYHIIVSQS